MTPYSYRGVGSRFYPVIDILTFYKNTSTRLDVLVDSGAELSLFTLEAAQKLGLDMTKGTDLLLGGVGGRVKGYMHRLKMEIAGKIIFAPAIFTKEFHGLNLLGRRGVFEHFKITFDEKNLVVELR